MTTTSNSIIKRVSVVIPNKRTRERVAEMWRSFPDAHRSITKALGVHFIGDQSIMPLNYLKRPEERDQLWLEEENHINALSYDLERD